MFAETLPVISALNSMQMAIRTEVRAVNEFALTIEVQSPGVAAALAKKFELVRQRMITPDALLKFQATNVRRDGAALASVKPAIRSPRERVGNRVCILHAEAGEANDRITVRNIVLVSVWVEQQVRNVQHKNATV